MIRDQLQGARLDRSGVAHRHQHDLVHVGELVETVQVLGGRREDELDSPAAATAWLVERELVPASTELLEYCQSRLSGLRQDLRSLLESRVDGVEPDGGVLDRLNRALTRVPSAPLLAFDSEQGLHRAPGHPVTQLVEHAMAQIAEDVATLLTGEDAEAVARCASPPCDRFLLRTHARRHWCSTRCGDRARAARAYERRRGGVVDG